MNLPVDSTPGPVSTRGADPARTAHALLEAALATTSADAGLVTGPEGAWRVRAIAGTRPDRVADGPVPDVVKEALADPGSLHRTSWDRGEVVCRALRVPLRPSPRDRPGPETEVGSAAPTPPSDRSPRRERRSRPARAVKRSIGTIALIRWAGSFEDEDLEGLDSLLEAGGALVARAEWIRQEAEDEETGLLGRPELLTETSLALGVARNEEEPLALGIVGIEDFRDLRESIGRNHASFLLRKAAERLRTVLRSQDTAFRYGIGSFAIIYPATDRDGGEVAVERAREAVDDVDDAIQVSGGLAVFPEDARDADSLVSRADQALFLAEVDGGDQVRVFEPAFSSFALRTDDLALLTGDAERDRRNILTLLDTIVIVNHIQDRESLLSALLDLLVDLGRADRGILLLAKDDGPGEDRRDDDAPELEVELAQDARKRSVPPSDWGRVLVEEAVERRTPVLVTSHDRGADGPLGETVRELGLRRAMALPLLVKDRVLGAIYLDARGGGSEPTSADLVFLQALSREIGIAIENARLYEENLELVERLSERVEEQEKAIEEVRAANEALEETISTKYDYDRIVGKSKPMQQVFRILDRVTDSHIPVLITGESGTGKELVAKCLHLNGPRRRKRFVSINCAAIADSLLESELFGHVRGAFTGADRDHVGLFEQADGGTIFLDEIQNMSPTMQRELLRVLEEGELRPVGGKELRTVDVRVISATNADLQARIADDLFREDLYYRLNVIRISLPPLRDRKEDIPLLVRHFLGEIAGDEGRATEVEPRALARLMDHSWPGNVRELRNSLERAMLMMEGGVLREEDLDLPTDGPPAEPRDVGSDDDGPPLADNSLLELPYKEAKDRFAESYVRAQLDRTGGNVTEAAREAGVVRSSLHKIMRRYGIESDPFR